jgi:hypothetical protein
VSDYDDRQLDVVDFYGLASTEVASGAPMPLIVTEPLTLSVFGSSAAVVISKSVFVKMKLDQRSLHYFLRRAYGKEDINLESDQAAHCANRLKQALVDDHVGIKTWIGKPFAPPPIDLACFLGGLDIRAHGGRANLLGKSFISQCRSVTFIGDDVEFAD